MSVQREGIRNTGTKKKSVIQTNRNEKNSMSKEEISRVRDE